MEQRFFVHNSNNDCIKNVPGRMSDGEQNSDIEDMMTAKEVATTAVCGNLRKVQCVCEKGAGSV